MTKKFVYFLGLFMFGSLVVSCNKGCDFPEDTNTGDIIVGAIVSGVNSGGNPSVYHGVSLSYDFEVSFDNGYTYVPVDWTKYAILNFPVTAGCHAHYERNVTITPSTQNAKYKIVVESCPDCETEYLTDNWVLVKAFPASYSVSYEKKVK